MFKSNTKMFFLFCALFIALVGLSLYTQEISYAYTQQVNNIPNIAATEATTGIDAIGPAIPNIAATEATVEEIKPIGPVIPNIAATEATVEEIKPIGPTIPNIAATHGGADKPIRNSGPSTSFKMRMAFSSIVYFK